jgi:LCP family protein required for cell wall assembly
MSPIEEELRAAFARHEVLTPAAGPVRTKIDIAWVRAKRRRLMRRVTGAAAAVLMAGAAGPVAVAHWPHATPPVAASADLFVDGTPDRSLDVLLLGSDNRLRWKDPKNSRADTVMIIHVPADRSRAYLISLPRDGEVTLPGGARAKLTETLLSGPAVTEQVVSELTGVEFDATVTTDFRALRGLVAAVGGVEMCLPQGFVSTHNGKRYPQGCQRLGAADIGPVLQERRDLANGSYDRDRNAQRFLRALAAKLAADGTLTSPIRVNALLQATRDGMEIDGDPATLLRGAAAVATAGVVGVGEPGARPAGRGRELIYPEVGPALYAAIRDDTLSSWVAANPDYVLK